MNLSFPTFFNFLHPRLRSCIPASGLVLACVLAFSSQSAFCSSPSDDCGCTNCVFYDIHEARAFMDAQAAELERITNRFAEVEAVFESTYDQFYNAYVEAMFLEEKLNNGDLSVDPLYASSIRDCRDYLREGIGTIMDITPEMRSLGAQIGRVADALSDPNLPCYSAGGGCECPDYTGVLQSISNRVTSIDSYIQSHWDSDITWTVDMLWNFLHNADFGATGIMPDDRYEGQGSGLIFGNILSNVWASASPNTFLRRTQRYSQYIDNDAPIDLEPEPQEVASDAPLVAIIGLLYRIQHKLYQTNAVDVMSSWRDDYERDVEEKEDEAEAASDEISLDDIPEAPSDVFPFSDLFHIFELLNDALDGVLAKFPDTIITENFIVVDTGGFGVQLGGSDTAVGTSQTLAFNPVRSSSSPLGSGGFYHIFDALFSVIWYALGGIVALLLCQWLFKTLVSFISLSFSIIGGDFSSAVKLLEKAGSRFAGE